jgi:hypothetical protein
MTVGRDQIALLDLSTTGGITMQRWHSRHGWGAFTWEGQVWSHQPFEHSGISSGGALDEATAALSLPRLPSLEQILRQAHRESWRGRLRVVHWDDDAVTTGAPPATGAYVMATFRGVLALQGLTLTGIEAALDASLLAGPGGGQFPPTIATSTIIGTPVVLKEGR